MIKSSVKKMLAFSEVIFTRGEEKGGGIGGGPGITRYSQYGFSPVAAR